MPTPPTILIVDDSRAIRQILGRSLKGAGHFVLEANNGLEGLAVARAEAPDLILLDIDMPIMDGLAAMREISADRDLSRIPVLFLTARTDSKEVAAGLSLGAQDYLRKPCEPEELLARVGTALRLHGQRVGLEQHSAALQDLSSTDPLTGLGNRRRFDMRVSELRAAHNGELPVGVAMIDLDHFKNINDDFGHLVGDTVLTLVARLIRGAASDDDTLVRWGGEEFMVLRAGADAPTIGSCAEQMRSTLAESPLAVGVNVLVRITLSAGWATGMLANLDDVIAAADEAVYAAKQSGRNAVVG